MSRQQMSRACVETLGEIDSLDNDLHEEALRTELRRHGGSAKLVHRSGKGERSETAWRNAGKQPSLNTVSSGIMLRDRLVDDLPPSAPRLTRAASNY